MKLKYYLRYMIYSASELSNSYYRSSISLILFFIVTFVFFISIDVSQSFAISPTFSLQQISDGQNDWISMDTKRLAISKGASVPFVMGVTDIEAVSYFSDGKILNATLWTYFPFINKPIMYEQVNYGMLIDSDFDKSTGYGGIDYLFQIGWNNNTKRWNKNLWELSPTGEQQTLIDEHNFTGFYEHQKAYVVLPLNLSYLHYPNKYKITFYAEVKKKDQDGFLTDFTKTVAIPPLKLSINTIPTSLAIRPGESKDITLRINSTNGFEPTVYLSTSNNNKSEDITSALKFDKIRIPSYGVVTIPMRISSKEDTLSRTYTIFIFANSTFPPENQIKEFIPSSASSANSKEIPQQSEEKSQNVIGISSMLVTVSDPLTLLDKISEFWSKVGNPLQFFYGVLAGLSPWIYKELKNKIKKD